MQNNSGVYKKIGVICADEGNILHPYDDTAIRNKLLSLGVTLSATDPASLTLGIDYANQLMTFSLLNRGIIISVPINTYRQVLEALDGLAPKAGIDAVIRTLSEIGEVNKIENHMAEDAAYLLGVRKSIAERAHHQSPPQNII